MSKNEPTRAEAAKDPVAADLPPVEPLQRRKGLFIVMCVVFAAWVGFLTTLYFKTVYGKEDPHAHGVVDQPPEKRK